MLLIFNSKGDTKTAICGINELHCFSDAVVIHRRMRYFNDTYAAKFRAECNCLPSCVDIQFNSKISELDYINPNNEQRQDTYCYYVMISHSLLIVWRQINIMNFSVNISTMLTLTFDTNEFLLLKRSEKYADTMMFSTCGGLLGLFMGISLLNITEIFFYLILQIVHKFSKWNDRAYTVYPYTP